MFLQRVIAFNFVLAVCQAVYQDTSYPYGPGPLAVTSYTYNPRLMPFDPAPMNTKVHYPTTPGEYAVFYFITGMGGIIPTFFYDELMTIIASHGYVVFDTWALAGEEGPSLLPRWHLDNLDWLEENAWEDMNGTVASFRDMSVGCHSAGCEFHMHVALNRTDDVKSMINLEPVAESINRVQPSHYLPAFSLGSELANNSCSVPGFDFETWHSQLDCPKIMVETADAGHCDFLDFEWYAVCRVSDFCNTGPAEQIADYQALVAGLTSAFMTAYVQGNMDHLAYVTDPSLIPWALIQHEVEIDC